MKRDTSKTKTKRARAPRLPNPKESRRTIQFRVTDDDMAAVQKAIEAATKILGITPSVSDVTRMAIVAYPAHARELADANRAREAAESKVSTMRMELADAIRVHSEHVQTISELHARLSLVGNGTEASPLRSSDEEGFEVPTEPEPVTCEAGKHTLMFQGPCEDCREDADAQDAQGQAEMAAEAG